MTYNAMPDNGGMGMDADRMRLQMLLEIARKHRLSLDDLDDESRNLDLETFNLWARKMLEGRRADSAGALG